MKLTKDNAVRVFTNEYDINFFLNEGWVEVKEEKPIFKPEVKEENVVKKTTKKSK